MNSREIRAKFFQFFEDKGHKVVVSAPMVIKNDPTLMFTNAGMNQFKDLFLGNSEVKYARVCDTQKCLRVSGKHNDLEEVGHDTYHHTMFEMLGNWSFGDYFKKEAIEWAWELLTEIYRIDKDRLYVSIFEGAEDDDLAIDQEAYDIWKEHIVEDRIIKGNKKDNFWEMGDVGPCGPCSEIHVDIRSDEDRTKVDGRTLVNADHPQVIEVWNLVFMQYNRKANGILEKLPNTHVDTGMGFERLCMVMQGVQSNYDTDVFQPLIQVIAKKAGKTYGAEEKADIAMRVIADHLRAISFSIADGQLPSNTGAGYVIRRILRRAVRYGFTFLNFEQPSLFALVSTLVREMCDQFPELKAQAQLIEKVIKEEEVSFLKTLEKGISRFKNLSVEDKTIAGKDAFELYDTYGFPLDLTQLIASEKGLSVDVESFNACLQEQKNRSRQATAIETDDWVELSEDEVEEFVGYDQTAAKVKITRYRKVKLKGKEFFQLVFNITPFYPEGGGQVGDNGFIETNGQKTSIIDTKKENNLIIHFAEELPSDPKAIFQAEVDVEKRSLTANNHSATHLLHETLREVLGEHVEQKGSLVNDKYLRFDFSHFSKVSNEELSEIEQKVNAKIRANYALNEHRNIPLLQAQEMGAMALFGEKYGDTVRAIQFGSSIELCGGIHVAATGQIGLFKITSESAIAAGIRRIEAITSEKAIHFYNQQLETIQSLRELIKNQDVLKGVQNLLSENQTLSKHVAKMTQAQTGNIKGNLLKRMETINGVNFIAAQVELDAKAIKNLAFELKKEQDNLLLVLCAANAGKATITVAISESLAESKDLHAGNMVSELAQEIKGGGGGQAFFATAGGKDVSGIPNALEKAKEYLA
ncbi:MAG: alanine--tRNA ligase [Flavobacteriales bacterium]|nr:alanine--tRNA ligase [Flavobacteriales bacterium]|tara:strand:- start:834 stop:3431 length:2598 start_codon:yes stop_codon:yes gene_type:complete